MVVRAGCLPAGTPLFQPCWMAATKSQIHPLESWEKPQGMPAVILIKHMLPRGKTQPAFITGGTKSCPRTPLLSETARPDADALVSDRSKPLGSLSQWHSQPGLSHLPAGE